MLRGFLNNLFFYFMPSLLLVFYMAKMKCHFVLQTSINNTKLVKLFFWFFGFLLKNIVVDIKMFVRWTFQKKTHLFCKAYFGLAVHNVNVKCVRPTIQNCICSLENHKKNVCWWMLNILKWIFSYGWFIENYFQHISCKKFNTCILILNFIFDIETI